jgi:hypothetical protein
MNRWMLLLLLLAGCSPRRDLAVGNESAAPSASLGKTEEEKVIVIVFDLSSSFQQRMANDGEAYKFALHVIDRYLRDTIGSQDKLVITQISNTQRSLLWEGTPMALRRQFPTPEKFRDFLLSKSDPNGSQVTKGLRNALQYLLSDAQVVSGKAKAGLFCMSDLLDTDNVEREEGYLNHELSVLGLRGGLVGLYWVDQEQVGPWRHRLLALGVKNFRVESEIVGQPVLPSFE